MSCEIPLPGSLSIYNHEFKENNGNILPVYNHTNKLLIIPSPGNVSPAPNLYDDCRNSLNDDPEWSFTDFDGGECTVDRLIKEENFSKLNDDCIDLDPYSCLCDEDYGRDIRNDIPLNEIMAYCKKNDYFNIQGLSDKLKKEFYRLKDQDVIPDIVCSGVVQGSSHFQNSNCSEAFREIYDEHLENPGQTDPWNWCSEMSGCNLNISELPSIEDFDYGCKSVKNLDNCNNSYGIATHIDNHFIKKCNLDGDVCSVSDIRDNCSRTDSGGTDSGTCKNYICSNDDLEVDKTVIWPCPDGRCSDFDCCIPKSYDKCYRLGNEINNNDGSLTNRDFCNKNCNVYSTSEENLWRDYMICSASPCQFYECCGKDLIPAVSNPPSTYPECINISNELEENLNTMVIKQTVDISTSNFIKVPLAKDNLINFINTRNDKRYSIVVSVSKKSEYWYPNYDVNTANEKRAMSDGGNLETGGIITVDSSPNLKINLVQNEEDLSQQATSQNMNFEMSDIDINTDNPDMSSSENSPEDSSPTTASSPSPTPNSGIVTQLDLYKIDDYFLEITVMDKTDEYNRDIALNNQETYMLNTKKSLIYKLYIILLIIILNILFLIVFFIVTRTYKGKSLRGLSNNKKILRRSFNFLIISNIILLIYFFLIYKGNKTYGDKDILFKLFNKYLKIDDFTKLDTSGNNVSKILNKFINLEKSLSDKL